MVNTPLYLLTDNGSLRPEATLSLRRLAGEVSQACGVEVHPVSLLHSSRVEAELLDGEPAVIFEPWMKKRLEEGVRSFRMLPLFFGPTKAITEYLPERIAFLEKRYGPIDFRVAPMLGGNVLDPEPQLVDILRDQVGQTVAAHGLCGSTPVILVDHGSPVREVATLRDSLANRLQHALGGDVLVIASSMERREGDAYAFNEPLLERALLDPRLKGHDAVIISMLFLQPGRHAGPGGDVATICKESLPAESEIAVHMSPLVGEHPLLVAILKTRFEQMEGDGEG